MKLFVVATLLLTLSLTQLTLPLTHHNTAVSRKPSHFKHLRSASESYKLRPKESHFSLKLQVNGFDYQLAIDTGSSDFFVKGEGVSGVPDQKIDCFSCRTQNLNIRIGYLDGNLRTYQLNASILLGTHLFQETILVAYQTDNGNYEDMGGIVGLSYQKIARNPAPNFINTLINNNIIKKYQFGVMLNFRNKESSFITFGEYDQKYFAKGESIHFYPISSTHRSEYNLAIEGMNVGSKFLPLTDALFDTGNTCISIPQEYTEDILSQFNVQGNQCYFEDEEGNTQFKLMKCYVETFRALPTLEVKFNDKIYPVPKEYYLDYCKRKDERLKCDTLLESVSTFGSRVILGDTFFLRYYTVFDLEEEKIGIVKNKDKTTLGDVLRRKASSHKQSTDV